MMECRFYEEKVKDGDRSGLVAVAFAAAAKLVVLHVER